MTKAELDTDYCLNEDEIMEAIVINPPIDIVEQQTDIYSFQTHPAWSELIGLERAPDLLASSEQFNPIQPLSDFVQRDTLPRPFYEEEWLEFPFPSITLPVNRLRRGDHVLISLSFSGDITAQGIIDSMPGDTLGAGPNRMTLQSFQVGVHLLWINHDHRSVLLPDESSAPGVDFVGDLYRRASWLFPFTSIAYVTFGEIHIPVLSNASLHRHYFPLKNMVLV
jgi:hypothetical protein